MLLRHRYLILKVVFVAAVISVAVGLLAKRTYTVTASFTPQSNDKGLGRLAGIAAQFGFANLPTGSGPTPEFYADVMTSRQLLRSVVETPLAVGRDSARKSTLTDLLEVPGEGAIRRERAVDRLRESVGVVTSTKTGLVEVNVRMPSPQLAQQVTVRNVRPPERVQPQDPPVPGAGGAAVRRAAPRRGAGGASNRGERAPDVPPAEPDVPGLTPARLSA